MQLLEHFKELTLHPKNTEELKGLILQLAIQGKLTKQWRMDNPDVESASFLLERINEGKERLIKEKKIKKEKPLPEISEEEIPYLLPNSWTWCTLGDLNREIHYGYTASALHTFGGIRMLRITDIQDNKVNWDRVPDCDIKEKDFLKYKLEENDILIARTGGTIGKSYQVKGVNVNSVFASYLIRAIPMRQVFPEYIKQWLESPNYWKQLSENSQGTGQPNVNATALKGLLVSLPPLEEQKAIVEVVNQLFAEVEQLEALTKERIQLKSDFVTSALNQLTQAAEQDTASQWSFLQQHFGTFFTEKENIKKLREGILQLAVQGKLTHHWRTTACKRGVEVEPASTLLEKIKVEKEQLIKAGKIKKEKRLPEISEEEIPFDLPEGWVWEYLGNSMLKITDGTHHSPLNLENGDFKYVSAKNIKENGIKLSNITYVTEKAHREIYARCNPETGDLLYIKDGATTGICCINDLDEEFSMLSSVALLKLPTVILNEYLLRVMRSPYYYDIMREGMSGVAITRVTLTKLKASVIPIPPFEEQKAIVEKVNSLMALWDKLEQEIETHQTMQEKWMQSCLREVVEG
ncbi:restriction endonuclease subunit S [Aquiflexum sp.]|uniref:restriction endonuclease subunit S n=1 Tax=Aquiflexum sp. TaxID=1872584 RepID=UPI0035937C6D